MLSGIGFAYAKYGREVAAVECCGFGGQRVRTDDMAPLRIASRRKSQGSSRHSGAACWVRTQARQRQETAAEQPDEAYSIPKRRSAVCIARIWRSFAMPVPMKRCPRPCSTRLKTGPPTKVSLNRASGWASATMPPVRRVRSTCDSTQR